MIFEFYEGKNVKQSNVYNHYIHITDPFYIPTGSALKYQYKRLSRRVLSGVSTVEKSPTKLVHRYDNYLPTSFKSIEYKILNYNLLEDIKNHKGEFMIDRYVVEWNTKKYFLKRYKGILHRIEGNITIFFLKQYEIIYEDSLPSWKRNNILNQLL